MCSVASVGVTSAGSVAAETQCAAMNSDWTFGLNEVFYGLVWKFFETERS